MKHDKTTKATPVFNEQKIITAIVKELKQELIPYINAMSVLAALDQDKLKYFEGPVTKEFEKEIRKKQTTAWENDFTNNIQAWKEVLESDIKRNMKGGWFGDRPRKYRDARRYSLITLSSSKPKGRKKFHPEKFSEVVEDVA